MKEAQALLSVTVLCFQVAAFNFHHLTLPACFKIGPTHSQVEAFLFILTSPFVAFSGFAFAKQW